MCQKTTDKMEFFVENLTPAIDLQFAKPKKRFVNMNISFKRRNYVNKRGLSPIYLVITSQGKRIRKQLDLKVFPEDWDDKKQRFKKKAPQSEIHNIELTNIESKINNIHFMYKQEGRELTIEKLAEELENQSPSTDFIAFIRFHLEKQRFSLKKGSFKKEESRIRKMKEFKETWNFNEMNLEFIDNYVHFMSNEKRNNQNTISSNIKTLKKYFHLARRYGIRLQFDIEDVKTKNVPSNRTNLNINEVNALLDLYRYKNLNDRLKLPLGYFLFCCFTGIRLNEVKKVSRRDIDLGRIEIISEKTGKKQVLTLNNTAVEIASYSKLFVHFMSDQRMNDYIREACNICSIKKKVTFHVSRHTFATNFLRKGGKVEDLKVLLNHSDIKTTMLYVHDLKAEQIDTSILD